jgi:hypothetical protein
MGFEPEYKKQQVNRFWVRGAHFVRVGNNGKYVTVQYSRVYFKYL